MTTPDAPQEEPTKEASNGPLIENLKAPVNVTELSALGSPTDVLERDFLWIDRPDRKSRRPAMVMIMA